ncbi:MAG: hypothetical protein LUC37_00255 [Prevotella sp.]|nr:hypothetical protein [Prevotella sp.]
MKRLYLSIITVLICCTISAQSDSQARATLDKVAAVIGNKTGASANFTMSGKIGNTSGTITIKGGMFQAQTPQAIMWYDGKTQWTYMKSSQEVNVSTPSETQQQSMNPYKFINIYKSGYKLSQKTLSSGWEIHLEATDEKLSIKEMYITVNKSYQPQEIRILRSGAWSTITISNFKAGSYEDSFFRFNSKDYPGAEVIDLR